MERSKEIQKVVDNTAKKVFGKSLTEAMEEKVCVFCHEPINMNDFKDMLSVKEYSISGICQKCQDKVFG